MPKTPAPLRPDVVALIAGAYFGPLNDDDTLPEIDLETESPSLDYVIHADGRPVTDAEFFTMRTATPEELAEADQHRGLLLASEINGKRYMAAAIVLGVVLGYLVESDD